MANSRASDQVPTGRHLSAPPDRRMACRGHGADCAGAVGGRCVSGLRHPLGTAVRDRRSRMSVKTPSEQIDEIIAMHPDWRGQRLAQLRHVILDAAPGIGEDVKWKKPSRPEGVAVWTHGGNLCIGEVLKRAVRLTFPQGASLADPAGLFNTRLDS